MREDDTNAEAVALRALGWTLSDGERASRLLALTGLSPDDLRARLGERALLASTLAFLEAHEPDLIACSEAVGLTPVELVSARRALEA